METKIIKKKCNSATCEGKKTDHLVIEMKKGIPGIWYKCTECTWRNFEPEENNAKL